MSDETTDVKRGPVLPMDAQLQRDALLSVGELIAEAAEAARRDPDVFMAGILAAAVDEATKVTTA